MEAFLREHRVKHKEPFTHTSKIPSASYYIGEDSHDEFMTLYCNHVAKGGVPCLTEKPGMYGPLRVDVDLKASLDQGLKRQYTDDLVDEIIGFYQDEMRKIIDPKEMDEDERNLWCLVLQKSGPRVDDGIVKDGFHLHWPHFICEGWVMDELLRVRVLERMIREKVWKGCKYTDPVEKFIDAGKMSTKTWMMYGSSKAPGWEPFLYTRAINHELQEVALDEIFREEYEGRKSAPDYYLPQFLSVRGYPVCTKLKAEVESKKGIFGGVKRKQRLKVNRTREMAEILEDLKMLREGQIMDMLADHRADDYAEWMDVGWSLFNISQGIEEGLELWIEFSRRSSKFVEGICEEKWGGMELRGKGIGSILAMARSDSPDLYKNWKSLNVETWIHKSIEEVKPNEWRVAQVIKMIYKDRFLCADPKKDIWFRFDEHRWKQDSDSTRLRYLMATEIVLEYDRVRNKITSNLGLETEARAIKEKEAERCKAISTALLTCPFQDRVIRMCKILFYDEKFLSEMDQNRKLFGCENGVLDLELGIFREGRPDDKITMTCKNPYQVRSEDDDEVQEVRMLFQKIFVNPNILGYFYDTTCSYLEGGNANKIFLVWAGDGDNAKSLVALILEEMLGDYAGVFPPELFIMGRGNSSGSARPELAQTRGKRWMTASEIPKNQLVDYGAIKRLSGGDNIYVRKLFGEPEKQKPQFTMAIQVNEYPKIPAHDEATWNRIRVLPFESKFVRPSKLDKWPVPEKEVDQWKLKRFHADLSMSNKIAEMAPILLWILVEHYKVYKKTGLKEPPEVKMATSAYQAENDVFLQFHTEKICKVEVQDTDSKSDLAFLKVVDLYAEFISWYLSGGYSKEKFSRDDIKREFVKRLGATKLNRTSEGWYGYKLVEEDMPEDEHQQKLKKVLEARQIKEKTAKKKLENAPGAEESESSESKRKKSAPKSKAKKVCKEPPVRPKSKVAAKKAK